MFGIEYVTNNPRIEWRIMLASGALPAIVILVQSLQLKDGAEFVAAQLAETQVESPLRRAFSQRNRVNLLAAGGSWFCLDYVWYSIAVSMPNITKNVFGVSSATTVALINCALLTLSIPGCLLSIFLTNPT